MERKVFRNGEEFITKYLQEGAFYGWRLYKIHTNRLLMKKQYLGFYVEAVVSKMAKAAGCSQQGILGQIEMANFIVDDYIACREGGCTSSLYPIPAWL